MYNMDRLWEAALERGPVCIGLDTAPDHVPPAERARAASDAAAVLAYNKALVDATLDVAACYKLQIACYEEGGLAGLRTYAETLAYIRGRGALAIADVKRGDIADTARRYAKAHFEGDFEADFVTLSPYMGMDSIEPWLDWAESKGKGAFVLLRTSNAGMRDFEWLELGDGNGNGDGKPSPPRRLYDAVGEKLRALAEKHRGVRGYGAFGAVVGCTEREEAALIRERYGDLFFLIPGYGAQGGAAADAALLLRDGVPRNGGGVSHGNGVSRKGGGVSNNGNDAPGGSGVSCGNDVPRRDGSETRGGVIPDNDRRGDGREADASLGGLSFGGVVNASRSIIGAWAAANPLPGAGNAARVTLQDAAGAAREAAILMRDALRSAAGAYSAGDGLSVKSGLSIGNRA